MHSRATGFAPENLDNVLRFSRESAMELSLVEHRPDAPSSADRC
jgi:hypothetical protein